VEPGDILILTTDGIRAGYVDGLEHVGDTQALADRILGQYAKGGDDALVLVARYLG
jgi:phosphoserine phosphatase RsbX